MGKGYDYRTNRDEIHWHNQGARVRLCAVNKRPPPAKKLAPPEFARKVLAWYDQHGRKDLPWQQNPTPYRVWVSEIMLQQTQVGTVIPYFERFIVDFPSVAVLAAASEDTVLSRWTGLGYYARARNLHRAAKLIADEHGGQLPDTVAELTSLPGIGRSTAGAIVSLAGKRYAVILDGNVKRVLARFAAIEGWPGHTQTLKQLWALAEELTPRARVGNYNQAMMDLGATLCTRSRPDCQRCPLVDACQAHQIGAQTDFPGKKPRKTLPVRSVSLLMPVTQAGEVLLEKRPPVGVWGGLYSFFEQDKRSAEDWCLDNLGALPASIEQWPGFRHTFSHYHLDITPILLRLEQTAPQSVAEAGKLWYNMRQRPDVGLAAPVQKLLERLALAYNV